MKNNKLKNSLNTIAGLMALTILFSTLPASVFAQTAVNVEKNEHVFVDRMDNWSKEMDKWGEDFGDAIEYGFPLPQLPELFSPNENDGDGPVRLGLYLDNIDFETAYKNHYPHNYGVYVSSVIKNGSADKAGIISGDIIMTFNGEKVRYEKHLLQLRDSQNIGDVVPVTIFRSEKEMTVNLEFLEPEIRVYSDRYRSDRGKRLTPGYGGGGPELFIMNFSFDGINKFLKMNGFDGMSKGYTNVWGGFGMGNVGDGLFIGGMGAGMEKREKIKVDNVTRRYKFQTGFGGVTVTKKYPFRTNNIVFDFEMLLGGGETSIEVYEIDGDFSWNDVINESNSYSLRYKKGYFLYRPSVGLLVRIKNWVGVHGSVGYLGTYSPNGKWEDTNFKYTVQGDSPDTPSGLSYTLGIWFGF